jgi:hypothetical protein
VADSVDSKWFEEWWVKDTAGNVIGMDARGQMEDGPYWRTALFLGRDTASYWPKPGKKPDSAEKIIDSACLAKSSTR